jgi:dGTPase
MSTELNTFASDVIQFAQDQENMICKLDYRINKEYSERSFCRNNFEIDYARILYSSSFRRLQGKMQMLGIDSSNFHRNRLTHSLEVAQIARSIASCLKLISPIVCESASLAHDIGNPPFGHSGEMKLCNLSDDIGGFEGNAQTFRILNKLEKKHYSYEGLNLTLRTLMATVKYCNKRDETGKYIYDSDFEFLKSELKKKDIDFNKTIDAQIMDLADEIAYAAHDLEDALSFRMLSLGEIVYEFKIDEKYNPAHIDIKDVVEKAQIEANKANRLKSSEEYFVILKKEITSIIVNTLIKDIGVVDNQLGFKSKKLLSEGLKKLLFKVILRKKEIQQYEKKGEKILNGLYEVYTDTTYNKKNVLLPAELRSSNENQKRIVIDYLAGMMDDYSEKEYVKYFGKNSLEAIYFQENH